MAPCNVCCLPIVPHPSGFIRVSTMGDHWSGGVGAGATPAGGTKPSGQLDASSTCFSCFTIKMDCWWSSIHGGHMIVPLTYSFLALCTKMCRWLSVPPWRPLLERHQHTESRRIAPFRWPSFLHTGETQKKTVAVFSDAMVLHGRPQLVRFPLLGRNRTSWVQVLGQTLHFAKLRWRCSQHVSKNLWQIQKPSWFLRLNLISVFKRWHGLRVWVKQ